MNPIMCFLGPGPMEKPLGAARTGNLQSFSLATCHHPLAPLPISLLVSPPKRDKGAESLLWVIKNMHVDPLQGSPPPRILGGQLRSLSFPG